MTHYNSPKKKLRGGRKSPRKRKSRRKSCRSNQRRSRKTGRCRLLPHIAKARRRASAATRKHDAYTLQDSPKEVGCQR